MKKILLLILFFTGYASYAQLPDFTLTVTPTPQTCLGDGSLTFQVAGTAPGATIGYEIFLLPDTTTPVVTTTSTTVNSLVAGTYMVVATQTLDGDSNTATANATITNDGSNLEYLLVPAHVKCGEDGEILVDVTTGIGVSYEIIAGPETFPSQASNVFTGLLPGQYQVRVTDSCGNAIVTTIQLVQIPTDIIIENHTYPDGPLPACNLITVDNMYSTLTNYQIFYPLTLEYTVYPPGGGAPMIVTQVVPDGPGGGHFIADIPFFEGQEYSYDLEVTDMCGNVYTHNDNIVNESFIFQVLPISESCGNYFIRITPSFFVPPYTVNFLDAPAGFDPFEFNDSHPVQNLNEILYGSDENPMPLGAYEMQITDFCGNTYTHEFELVDEALPTWLSSINQATCSGQIGISMSGGRDMVSVTITDAPDSYPSPLPDDVSEFIAGSEFLLTGLPLGVYVFEVVDECGDTHIVTAEIYPSPENLTLSKTQRPGCEEGMGSIKISTLTANPFVSVIITSAPDSFGETLPFDASSNIAAGGVFHMNSLPGGVYTFETVDNCGTERNEEITIIGYEIISNDVDIIPNCESFNIDLDFVSNGTYAESFWLQEYDPITGTWGHPFTGEPYTEGTLPLSDNSVYLNNNQLNINLAYTGQFRILRVFHIFSNGNTLLQRCFEQIYDFTFDGAPVIDGAYVFPCSEGEHEVIINANGVEPLTYEITTMDGGPFPVDNGASNLFSGLEEGLYNFRVTDVCSSFTNILVDVSGLEPMEVTAEGFCDGEASTLSVQDFNFLTYEWYAEEDPATILSTENTLTFPSFDPDTDSGTYLVTITATNPGSCINQTLEYEIVPIAQPDAGEDNVAELCNEGATLSLENYLEGQDGGGAWEDTDNTGALSGGMFDTEGIVAGSYEFTYVVTNSCGITDESVVTIILKDMPVAPSIDAVTPICEGEDIQLSATAVPGAVYAWSGPDDFSSDEQNPIIENATTTAEGIYTLTVTVNECTSPAASVAVEVDAAAQAGEDVTAEICNDGNDIDLIQFLSAGHDEGGTWTDIDGTGALTGNILSIEGLEAGTYEFGYTVTNACDTTDESTLTIELKDMPQVTAEEVDPICEGSDIQLTASEVLNAVYQWTGPDGFESAEQNPLIENASVLANGVYSLVVIVDGCTSPAATVNVTVNPAPQFTIDGPAELCEGQSGILTIDPDNFDTNDAAYEWYLDGELLPDVTSAIEILETGTYEVVVDYNGCTASGEIAVAQNTNAFTVELEAGCIDFEYVINITNIGELENAAISWTGPQGFTSSEASAVITDRPGGEYSVTVTNTEGCSAEASIQVDNTDCDIPRGVSPNNDGWNDNFDLSNLEVQEIKIFSRYGIKVYEAQNYINEWHGQSDKGDLPTGTYYYMITLSAGRQITGWVYLQREVN